jgi:hypothetical protein
VFLLHERFDLLTQILAGLEAQREDPHRPGLG